MQTAGHRCLNEKSYEKVVRRTIVCAWTYPRNERDSFARDGF